MKDRIWEMSSSGSGLHEVLPGWHGSSGECCGQWTPDGKFFLFLSDGQIWALDERRGLFRRPPAEPIQLTQGPIRWGDRSAAQSLPREFWGRPIPSKDGSKIFALGSSPRGELSRFDSKTKQFQPFLGGISAQGVVFSKDGKSIAYVSYPEGILWKANADGSNPVQLTDPPMCGFHAPLVAGRQADSCLRASSPGPMGQNYYIVSSDGGSPRRLFPDDENHGFLTLVARWTQDG